MAPETMLDASRLKKTLETMTVRLVESSAPGSLYDAVVQTAMESTDAEACSLYLEDIPPEGGVATTLSMVAGAGFEEHRVGKASYRKGEGLTGTIWRHGISVKCDSTAEVEDPEKGWLGKFNSVVEAQESRWICRSLIGVPLRIGTRTIGLLKVENKREPADHFADEDQTVLEVIASTMALAIENRRLSEQTSREILSALHEMSGMIASDPGRWGALDRLCRGIVRTCVELFSAQAASLYLEEPASDGDGPRKIRMVAGAGYEEHRIHAGYELGEGLTGSIWENAEPVKFDTTEAVHGSGHWSGKHDDAISEALPEWVCSSLIGVPLRLGDTTIGVLKVENKKPAPEAHFTDEERETLQIIASIVALAVQTTSQMRRIFEQGMRAREVVHILRSRIKSVIENVESARVALRNTPRDDVSDDSLGFLQIVREGLQALQNRLDRYEQDRPSGNEEIGSVQQLVENVASDIRAMLAEDGIKLELDIPSSPIFIRIVPSQMEAALFALVWNAVEAMHGQAAPPPVLCLRVAEATRTDGPDWVDLSVVDNGPGLSAEQLTQFEKEGSIRSTKGPNRGLGVKQAYWIIRMDHGGYLDCLSPPNGLSRGTEFRACLPVEPTRALKLLIIDDDEGFGQGIQMALRHRDDVTVDIQYTPACLMHDRSGADRGAGAVQPGQYDYILLDCQFESGESGLDVYRRVLGRDEQLARRILLMSGYPEEREDRWVKVYDKFTEIRERISEVMNALRAGQKPL